MITVFLGIGSNLGNRENNLKQAVAQIEGYIGPVLKSSSIYITEPWGFKAEQEFLNLVVKIGTNLTPSGVLDRVRDKKQYTSRLIDIDILLYEDLIVDEEILKIPHPLLHKRKFVLVPLCEIGSEMIHPVLNKSLAELMKSCEDQSGVKKYIPPKPLKGG
jgi:2-amino-4-hydroxy-6-hydroxymethyldihydropteridine diphosphokinase